MKDNHKDDTFLIEEKKSKPQEKLSVDELVKIEKRRRNRRYLISITVNVIIAIISFIFAMIWQKRFDLIGYTNIFWLSFLLMFFGAWIMFVYNKNILSPLIHGMKVFGLMFVGKRTKESYYEYSMRIKENPIPLYIYLPTFIIAFILLIPSVVLMIISL